MTTPTGGRGSSSSSFLLWQAPASSNSYVGMCGCVCAHVGVGVGVFVCGCCPQCLISNRIQWGSGASDSFS